MKRLLLVLCLFLLIISHVSGAFFPTTTTKSEYKVKLSSDRQIYSPQEVIGVAILLYTHKDCQLQFSSGQIYDLYLQDEGKRIIWHLSSEKKYIQSLTTLHLKANDPLLFCEVINLAKKSLSVKPGDYELVVEVKTKTQKVKDSTFIRIR